MGKGLEEEAVHRQWNTIYWRKVRNRKAAAEEQSEEPLCYGDPQGTASRLEGARASPSFHHLEPCLREKEPKEKAGKGEMCF